MKSIIKLPIKLLKNIFFPINLLKNILNPEKRIIRISPNKRGNVYFYDKKKKNLFSFFIRDGVDFGTAEGIFKYNGYDFSDLKRYDELLKIYNNILSQKKLPIIIDCGANIGLSAYYFANEFPQAKIVALEPEKITFL